MKEASFVMVMRCFAAIYIAGGLIFFFFNKPLASILMMQEAPNQFWVVLSVSMMSMLAYLSWCSSRHPHERSYVTCHVLAKVISVIGFLLSFVIYERLPAYLVGAVVDLSVIAVVLHFYRRVNAD